MKPDGDHAAMIGLATDTAVVHSIVLAKDANKFARDGRRVTFEHTLRHSTMAGESVGVGSKSEDAVFVINLTIRKVKALDVQMLTAQG